MAVLDKLEHCAATNYQICTDPQSDRNSFDRPLGSPALLRTVTWNPGLQTVIELGCGDDPTEPVLRDSTASLLHELTHAAQDCDGLEPSEYEFEAVRIENIYRRAVGMCQRNGYGDARLPRQMIKLCSPGKCSCTAPADPTDRAMAEVHPATQSRPRPDTVSAGDARPVPDLPAP